MITTKPITIYELFRRGEIIAISIDRRGFLADRIRTSHRIRNSKGQLKAVYSIRAKTVIAGVVCGELVDWSGGHGKRRQWKLHYECPQCHQRNWEDSCSEDRSPYMSWSVCRCMEYWLIEFKSQ
jgi:hypothetical protein